MKNIQTMKEKIRKLYKEAPDSIKIMFEKAFPSNFLKDVTDFIKTYEDACIELQIEPLNELEMLRKGFTSHEINYRKLKTIIMALNGDWKASWGDLSQEKWFLSFNLTYPKCLSFDRAYCHSEHLFAGYSLSFCFKSKPLAEYAAKQFIDLYAQLLLD